MARPVTPQQAGSLSKEAFVQRFGGICEHSPWVAEGAWQRRPFDDFDALAGAFEATVHEAPHARQLALVRAHPELAGRERDELTEESASEQSSAGLDRLSPAQAGRLQALNHAHSERFEFPLVIAVRGLSAAAIIERGEARLANTREKELDTSLREVMAIARMRLREIVGDDDMRPSPDVHLAIQSDPR
jgi:2-oxo-4-hydroxy-4-carboxy-5-ureidoimidazoline decarboxylase